MLKKNGTYSAVHYLRKRTKNRKSACSFSSHPLTTFGSWPPRQAKVNEPSNIVLGNGAVRGLYRLFERNYSQRAAARYCGSFYNPFWKPLNEPCSSVFVSGTIPFGNVSTSSAARHLFPPQPFFWIHLNAHSRSVFRSVFWKLLNEPYSSVFVLLLQLLLETPQRALLLGICFPPQLLLDPSQRALPLGI